MDLIFLKFSSKQRRNNAYSWGWRASKISCYHQRCSLDRDRMQTTPHCVAFPEVDDVIRCGLSRGLESQIENDKTQAHVDKKCLFECLTQ